MVEVEVEKVLWARLECWSGSVRVEILRGRVVEVEEKSRGPDEDIIRSEEAWWREYSLG
jgi:chorismate-pyruvate lyase